MKLILLEDELAIRSAISVFLENNNINVDSFSNGEEGYNAILNGNYDLVLSDNMMPGLTGLQILSRLKRDNFEIPFILMTAYSNVKDAVSAMKDGAEDYLTKPLDLEELLIKINKVLKQRNLAIENNELKEKLRQFSMPKIVGESSEILRLKELIVRVADDNDISAMIYGESGAGKELVAEYIHKHSERADKPFIPINCAAIPKDLMESELFGYRKGAFTGALQDKIGLIEAANGGTLFLDEVSEMSPDLQSKFLRVLQELKLQPIGTTDFVELDIRVIGASNVKIENLVNENKFRQDLFYRLNVIEINVPPLRDRKNDIPLLINHFIYKYKNDRKRLHVSPAALKMLTEYKFPGNVRELENIIRGLFVTCDSNVVHPSNLSAKIYPDGKPVEEINLPDGNYQYELQKVIEEFDRNYLLVSLKNNNGNISQTAEAIGLSRVSLHKKIKQLNLNVNL
jgi:DNA-binding NtrC family response regulator